MRLSELIGHRVLDQQGDEIGSVADVRLVQDGPLQGARAAFRVDGLIVVEGHATRLFGYERHVGPALFRWIMHLRLGEVRYLPWDRVRRVADGQVIETVGRRDALPQLADVPRR